LPAKENKFFLNNLETAPPSKAKITTTTQNKKLANSDLFSKPEVITTTTATRELISRAVIQNSPSFAKPLTLENKTYDKAPEKKQDNPLATGIVSSSLPVYKMEKAITAINPQTAYLTLLKKIRYLQKSYTYNTQH